MEHTKLTWTYERDTDCWVTGDQRKGAGVYYDPEDGGWSFNAIGPLNIISAGPRSDKIVAMLEAEATLDNLWKDGE